MLEKLLPLSTCAAADSIQSRRPPPPPAVSLSPPSVCPFSFPPLPPLSCLQLTPPPPPPPSLSPDLPPPPPRLHLRRGSASVAQLPFHHFFPLPVLLSLPRLPLSSPISRLSLSSSVSALPPSVITDGAELTQPSRFPLLLPLVAVDAVSQPPDSPTSGTCRRKVIQARRLRSSVITRLLAQADVFGSHRFSSLQPQNNSEQPRNNPDSPER